MVFTDDSSRAPFPDNASLAGLVDAYAAAITRVDISALEHLYERDAVLVPLPGTALAGYARSRACAEFARTSVGPMTVALRRVYQVGDLALLVVDWSVDQPSSDGSDVSLSGTATDVARRGADGLWRYVIDNPFGVAEARA